MDSEALIADLRHSFSVFGGSSSALDDNDPREHKEWLAEKRGGISWHFWHRYETWLEQEKRWAPTVIRGLDERTDEVLKRLENPEREGAWDRRGMVVGSVQSGKTANYTGLICKAVDAGYRVIVVLAGMHKNLRSQTQLRIDEGFLGFDTEKNRQQSDGNRKGAGMLPTPTTLHVMSLTSSADDGDFKRTIANGITGTLGGVPTVLVVKKNGRILRNLREWLVHLAGSKVVRGVPLLVIDDEADQASVNTKAKKDAPAGQEEDENDVSTINRRIREILASFEKKAYVGYTATPFANIFINPDAHGERLEDDIFPRSFILNVRPPGNYVGPARVFGFEEDPDTGIAGLPGIPELVNVVDDSTAEFPQPHKIDHIPRALPSSLIKAINCHLVCAARRARGQVEVHNSMLVHVTRFVPVQGLVTALVKDEVLRLRKRIQYGDGSRKVQVRDELRALWETEFAAKDPIIRKAAPEDAGASLTWAQVDAALLDAAAMVEVKEINGSASDVLDYVNYPKGSSVIAVGGDKLSRGLTLEGLSISYFLRTSRMYDTLMQMGRWFGYRPGYVDLCRLFTTDYLRGWYRHIALAEEELRREFDYMASQGATPENYGLGVRSHSEGLIVTALNKMCHARTLELSFAGELKQTAHFDTGVEKRRNNVKALESFLDPLPEPKEHKSRDDRSLIAWVWSVDAVQLCEKFFQEFSIHPQCHTIDRKRITDFIHRQNQQGELTTWTVALVNNTKANPLSQRPVAGFPVGLTERTGEVNGVYSTTKANIQSPSHQAIDLERMTVDDATVATLLTKRNRAGHPLFDAEEERLIREAVKVKGTLGSVALKITQKRAEAGKKPSEPNGRVIRELRPVSHGLLLIYALAPDATLLPKDEPPYLGLALSFPVSHTAKPISYEANRRLIAELQDDDYEDR